MLKFKNKDDQIDEEVVVEDEEYNNATITERQIPG